MLLLAVLLRLGLWQLERAEYKAALEDRFAVNTAATPRTPEAWLATGDEAAWQFRPARARGTPMPHRQYLLDNRTRQGRAGYHVLTVLARPGAALLVNRGWLPVGADRQKLPDIGLAAQPVELSGSLVPIPETGLLLGASGYEAGGWPRVVQVVDLERIAGQTGETLLPAMLLLDPAHPACFACEWTPVAGISAERHRGYALQWFSLATALVIIAAVVSLRAWRRHAGGR